MTATKHDIQIIKGTVLKQFPNFFEACHLKATLICQSSDFLRNKLMNLYYRGMSNRVLIVYRKGRIIQPDVCRV